MNRGVYAMPCAATQVRALRGELDGWKMVAEQAELLQKRAARELTAAQSTIAALRAAAADDNKENGNGGGAAAAVSQPPEASNSRGAGATGGAGQRAAAPGPVAGLERLRRPRAPSPPHERVAGERRRPTAAAT